MRRRHFFNTSTSMSGGVLMISLWRKYFLFLLKMS